MSPICGAFCSDLHLSDVPPGFRSNEPDWFAAMSRPLEEIRVVQEKYGCPVIYPGDIFDIPEPTPELINFACQNLPCGYAIPGQHDLRNHRLSGICKSAYWTLVEAGVIRHLEYGIPYGVGQLQLWGFPWGTKLFPLKKSSGSLVFDIAVVHKYIWAKDACFHGAPEEAWVKNLTDAFLGYDAVFVGDNHKGFQYKQVVNCGTMMIRSSNEVDYQPSMALLHEDGSITRHYFDTSKDVYQSRKKQKTEKNNETGGLDTTSLFQKLDGLSQTKVDFEEVLKTEMERRGTSKEVGDLIYAAIPKES